MSYQPAPEQPPATPPVPPGPALSAAQAAGLPPNPTDQQIDAFLQELLGGDLPGEGFLNPDAPGENEPRFTPSPAEVRDELLRAMRTMGIALQLPYSEEKKADLGHALLAAGQTYLLIDPSLDEEGLPAEGPGSKAHATAAAAAEFPAPVAGEAAPKRPTTADKHPKVTPNAAEEKLNTRTKGMQKDLQGSRGQTPRPRPRVGQ